MKNSKRFLSLLLACLMLVTALGVTSFGSVFAASGDTIYLKGVSFAPYCYMWNGSGESKNAEWPGVAMTALGDGVYSYTLPAAYDNVIFNNGSGGSGNQTGDMTFPGGNMIYDWGTGNWEVYDLSSVEPTVSISKKDGSTFKTDTIKVTVTATNADSAYYQVDGGSKVNFTNSADVTMGAGVAIDGTTSIFVSATNANGTATATATYTKKEASAGNGSDGSTAPALDGYFATNPNGQVGQNKTITIDGSISDWDSSMLIAQGVANDDPRVYRPSAMHEIPMDDYALYAAWDNSNLYLMWEVANVQDAIAPLDNFPLTQGNLWIYNLPVFLYFSTDSSIEGDGTVATGGTVWDSGITLDANIDTVVALSTNASNGPYVYKANDEGKIVYNDTVRSGIKIKWGNDTISSNLYGIDEGYGHYNNRVPGDVLDESSNWIDFYKDPEHKKSLDMFYEVSIPLDLLGISASDIEAEGIGLMKVSTFGTSGMNSLPADPSMWDNAAEEYSKDPTTTQEKEDADHITVPLARIGKMLSGGSTGPAVKPTEPTTEPTTVPTQPTTQEKPGTVDKYFLGDADADGIVSIKDASLIQKVVARLENFDSDYARTCADVDGDTLVTIKDASAIQKYCAQIATDYPIGEYVTK